MFASDDDEVILSLRKKYASLPSLVFLRSVEFAKDVSELFDIVDTVPGFPLTWCDDKRRWITTGLLEVK